MLAIPEEPSDTRLWGSSPSQGDFFYAGLAEYSPPYIEADEIAAQVECGQSCDEGYWYSGSTSAATSCTTSVASSEFSDDALIDIEDDDFVPLFDTVTSNFHLPSVENKFKGTHTQNKWRAECSDDDAKQSDDSLTNKKKERRKNSLHRQSRKTHECSCKKLEEHIDNLTWTKMLADEQVEAVEYITRVVSTMLGLREQLDIIRIINPDARVLPSDTEFVIDLDSFDDEKFETMKQYVSRHLPQESCPLCSESRSNACRQSSDSKHRKHCKRKTRKALNPKHISPKSKKHKGLLRRVHKQMLKERKSGLFENEQVIAMNQAEDKDEDIDILSL